MPSQKKAPVGQNRETQTRRTPHPSKVKTNVACLPAAVTQYLARLSVVCSTAAQTHDATVAALGLAVISRAPGELARLKGGRS
jgi:hypothetical protein